MLSLGVRGFPPLPPPCNIIPENPTSQSFLFPSKTYQTHLSFFSNRAAQLGFCTFLGHIRNGSRAFAIKSPRKGSDILLEMENLDLDDDYEEVEEGEEDDDDEDIVVPIRSMKKWLENRPPGFGEGKEYDTSIEDKLAEEMEQSRLAQLANINKLKNNSQNTNSKNEQLHKHKSFAISEAVPSGIPVRLVNLPKKKNIHRDLQQAFKGAHGIINIVPVVSGNKKTGNPSARELPSFISSIKMKHIGGKIVSGEYESKDDEHVSTVREDKGEKLETLSILQPSADDIRVLKEESLTYSLSSKQQQKSRVKNKKLMVKKKGEKAPKLNILGCANRLKIKEKAVLTDVFSKYGPNVDIAVKELS